MAIRRRFIYQNIAPGQSQLVNVEELDDVARTFRLLDASLNEISRRSLTREEAEFLNLTAEQEQRDASWLDIQRQAETLATSPEKAVILGVIRRLSGAAADVFVASIGVADIQGNIGNTIGMAIVMRQTPIAGLAGYALRAEIANSQIAKFTDVTFPPSFPLATHDPDPVDGPLLNSVQGVDLSDVIGPEQNNVTLATLQIELLARGTTEVNVDVKQLDDDSGFDIRRTVTGGAIQVT